MLYKSKVRAERWRLAITHPIEYRLYRRFRSYSMTVPRRFVSDLTLVRRVRVPGDLVECGTWEGGMSAAMACALPGRRSVLFDSFEGLPDAKAEDGPDASAFLVERGRLVAQEARAREAMERTRQPFDIRAGWFADTVPRFVEEHRPIAVLRLDGDWYESTMICLTHLFPLVTPGGLVIIDDYYDWEGCRRAVHDYLSAEGREEPIQVGAGDVYLVPRAT